MSSNSSGRGVVAKVAHGPSFLMVNISVTRGSGPTNPIEERRIRPWWACKGVPRGDCKILQFKQDLVDPNRNLSHQVVLLGMCVYGSPLSLVSPLFTPFSSLFQWTTYPFTFSLSTQTYLQLFAPCIPRPTHHCHRVTDISQPYFLYIPSPRGGWYLFTSQTPSLIPNLPTGRSPNLSNP